MFLDNVWAAVRREAVQTGRTGRGLTLGAAELWIRYTRSQELPAALPDRTA